MRHDPICGGPHVYFFPERPCPVCAKIKQARLEERQACAEDVANMLRHLPYVPANSPAAIEWAENYIRDIHDQAD